MLDSLHPRTKVRSKLPLVGPTIRKGHVAFPVPLILAVLALVKSIIGPLEVALPVHLTLSPVPTILPSVTPSHLAPAIHLIVSPFPLISTAIRPCVETVPRLSSVLEIAVVHIAIGIGFDPPSMLEILSPAALI